MLIAGSGVALHAQELGAGPPLVMLHGLFVGTMASWYFTAAPALARAHRVLLFDLRGHGKSERARAGYDLGTMAGDLDAAAAGLGDGPLDLVGHSFGALVALRFALDRPGRVRRLAFVDAPLPPSTFGELSEAGRDPARIVEALPDLLRGMLAPATSAAPGARLSRQGARLLEGIRFLAEDTTLLADLAAEPDVPDAELARLAVPVLCVYGDRSPCLDAGRRIARAVPGARLAVLAGGHFLHLDAAPALTAELVGFFDG